MKKFNKDIFWGIPLSTTSKTGKYYYKFILKEDLISNALLTQIRLLDSKRLISKIGMINDEIYNDLKNSIRSII